MISLDGFEIRGGMPGASPRPAYPARDFCCITRAVPRSQETFQQAKPEVPAEA